MNTPGRLARLIATLLAAVLGVTVLAGCGSSGSGQASAAYYTPAAYGQQIGGTFDCYYTTTPAEAVDLVNAGLCPANSVPTLMPLSWNEEYFAYYSSPAYYDTYMPASYRARYTSVTIIRFSKTYSRQITAAESKATYKSSTGGTVSGSKVNTKQFGSGTRGTTTYGGGTRNGGASGSGTTSKTGTTTGSRSGTGSYGGGSRGGHK